MVAMENPHAHAPQGFIRKYIFSLDHKVIGIQYFFLALTAVFVGMFLSLLMRIHLLWPSANLPIFGVIQPETYLTLLTMHGTIMVFFVLTTAPQGGFGNYFLPIQIGAPDMAFPVLNMLSFWTTFIAFVVIIAAFFVQGGAPLHGWTGYPPLSAVQSAGPGEGLGADLWITSIAIFCVASLMGALNFITTTLDLRAKGMTLMRMPLTVWSWFITAILGLLAFGVLLSAGILLLMDRNLGTSFYVPLVVVNGQILGHKGGSPLLWQHLFWFFGHPEVYIAIVPGFGIISHILPAFTRKPLLGGMRVMIGCMIAIGFLSYMVWGHHMFVSGMNPFSALLFSVPTLIITIPATVATLMWLGSIYGANLRFTSASLFCLGFISVFISGGISGFFLAQPAIDTYLHATYFVVAHFHFVMAVAAIFGIFAGTYFWMPKMIGRMMNETLGKLHFWLTFIGVYCIFMPMHYLGLAGNVRRYASFTDDYLVPLIPVHKFITIAALLTGAAQLIFLYNLIHTRWWGPLAPDNPWEATSLEWSTTSPPPFDNFGGRHLVVHQPPYEYSVEGAPTDHIMQTDPGPVVAH